MHDEPRNINALLPWYTTPTRPWLSTLLAWLVCVWHNVRKRNTRPTSGGPIRAIRARTGGRQLAKNSKWCSIRSHHTSPGSAALSKIPRKRANLHTIPRNSNHCRVGVLCRISRKPANPQIMGIPRKRIFRERHAFTHSLYHLWDPSWVCSTHQIMNNVSVLPNLEVSTMALTDSDYRQSRRMCLWAVQSMHVPRMYTDWIETLSLLKV